MKTCETSFALFHLTKFYWFLVRVSEIFICVLTLRLLLPYNFFGPNQCLLFTCSMHVRQVCISILICIYYAKLSACILELQFPRNILIFLLFFCRKMQVEDWYFGIQKVRWLGTLLKTRGKKFICNMVMTYSTLPMLQRLIFGKSVVTWTFTRKICMTR